MGRGSLIFWTLFGVVAVALAFGFSVRHNVDRMLKAVGTSEEDDVEFPDHGNLAVLEVKGVISDSDEALKDIRELEGRNDLKAVVLRISSPGGAVGPTQEIYDALLRLKTKKTLICSLGDIAASGGYYLASACEKIVANPGALTGSIGVIMSFMNLKNLYNWAKVEPYIIKSGKYKDIGSESRPMTAEEKALLQEMMDDVHGQFKDAVARGRKLTREYVDRFADGRIFSGAQAKKLGFVDSLGGEFEAIQIAGQMAGIKGKPHVVRRSSKKIKIRSLFEGHAFASIFDSIVGRLLPAAEVQVPLASGVPYFLPSFAFSKAR